jgi:deoxyadenosine/deoxycytidine kinase
MRIVIDGNIGCGKTTLMKLLETEYSNVYPEPVEKWMNWLKKYYTDMNKNSLGFQLVVLKAHMDNINIPSGIFERSPLSCQEVFGNILYHDNILDTLEYNLCYDYYKSYGWMPDIVIYLKCDPEICLKRIIERNRESEDTIPLEYLQKIHNNYEKLYSSSPVKTFIIDAEKNEQQILEDVKHILVEYLPKSCLRKL